MKRERAGHGSSDVPVITEPSAPTPAPEAATPDRLTKCVNEFCGELLATFAPRVERQAKGFRRRVLAMIAKRMPPYRKPTGRPRLRHVTLAAKAYASQKREVEVGRRTVIDWRRIALDCDPTFAGIRSDYKRRAVLKRLRDAVHARLSGGQKNERIPTPQIE